MSDRRSPVLKAALVVAIIGLTAAIGVLWHTQRDLAREILLARATMPGRTADQVRAWLGEPDYTRELHLPGMSISEVLIYRSTGPGTMQASEDVWVAIGPRDRVVGVFYPDYPTERQIVSAEGEAALWEWTWTPEAQFRAEWAARMQSYVSDRPDLSRPLQPEEPQRFEEHVGDFFETAGIELAEVSDVRYAIGEFGATLIRARLSDAQMQQFLKDKLHLEENAGFFLSSVYDGIAFEWQHPDDPSTAAASDMSSFVGYPFCRLDWWPVDLTVVEELSLHVGETEWDYWEVHVGATYYVLAHPDGTVYVLST
jgi:hypothetical protein